MFVTNAVELVFLSFCFFNGSWITEDQQKGLHLHQGTLILVEVTVMSCYATKLCFTLSLE